MTTTDTANGYLLRVRAELADLPPAELEAVMDDIAAHLTELAEELPAQELLEVRLGAPRQYADQLRAAAGYPPRPESSDRGTGALLWVALSTVLTPLLLVAWFATDPVSSATVFGWLVLGLAPAALGLLALGKHDPAVVTGTSLWRRHERRIRRYHALLPTGLQRDLVAVGQPFWWVLRGALGGIALYGVLARSTDAGPLLVAATVGALLSVRVGRITQRDRRWLWLVIPLNAVAVLAVAILLIGGSTAWGWDGYSFSGVHRIRY
ncbi:HAAS signaling domain-containing protein [Kribbella italica]|uniref:Uncharacterized protein n=1 Tax=Kribbella italica TaxID=1540520 RepID=A0A7W9JAF3_9ACTN|nr:hypothetical protein [Kribbella italica]MBB5838581.1 hypothetical protein [Kribbella italica]